jgi:hypothetical protein
MTRFTVVVAAIGLAVAPAAASAAYFPQIPDTGMNSPLVRQAQELMRRAMDIEMIAAQTPNDPCVKATAAAMAADLRGRAAIMMQVNSDNSRSQRDCRLADGRFVQCQ